MDFSIVIPEIIVAATGIIILLAEVIRHTRPLPVIAAVAGIATAMVLALTADSPAASMSNGLLAIDGWSRFLRLLLLTAALGVVLLSTDYYPRLARVWPEYHALLLFALTGMMVMSSAGDLIVAFVAVEVTAIALFILVGMLKDSRSSEASLKMMLLGGIAGAVMLYGMAMIFGASASTRLADISLAIGPVMDTSGGLLLGVLLMLAGFFFELAAVPFHMWAPDAYEGSPTPVTLYLSAASKIAGMAVIVRVLGTSFLHPGSLSTDWGLVVAAISAVTMTLGNLMALQQTNIKRLLAYSGIAHTGYMLIGIAVLGLSRGDAGQTQMLFYMAAFSLAEIAVFAAVIVITRHLNTDETGDFTGLGRRSPFLSAVLSLGLISLTGLPPTAGFMAKLYIFTGAIDYGLLWLIIIAVLNTVISAYYYFRIIKIMWVDQPVANNTLNLPLVPGLVAAVSAAGLLLLGMAPNLLIQITGYSLIGSP